MRSSRIGKWRMTRAAFPAFFARTCTSTAAEAAIDCLLRFLSRYSACQPLRCSNRDSLRRHRGERRHQLARETSQAFAAPRTAARAAPIDEDVSDTGRLQILEPPRDLIGVAV